MKWRKWNNILHRDLGYFFFGLTVIYAISGVASNHLRQWNSNFIVEQKTVQLTNITTETPVNLETIDNILEQVEEKDKYKSHFRPSRGKLQIFILDGGMIDVNLKAGTASLEKKRRRPVLREFNYLHLNHAQKHWTWVADIYAIALLLLAITGLFVLKGKNGLKGRGKWFVGAGILLPIIFLVLYFY